MKNRLLSFAQKSIPYIKELRPIVGSVTACILWQQLDFHFAKKPEGFYKFLESCNNNAYKEGDSWTQELGFSKEEFRTAFKKIGITSKSKRMYDCSENKFKRSDNTEAWFCSYHDKTKGLTYYFRNHEYVDSTLDSLFATANQEQQSTKIKNPDLCKLGIPISIDCDSQSTEIVNPNLHLITSETTTTTRR